MKEHKPVSLGELTEIEKKALLSWCRDEHSHAREAVRQAAMHLSAINTVLDAGLADHFEASTKRALFNNDKTRSDFIREKGRYLNDLIAGLRASKKLKPKKQRARK